MTTQKITDPLDAVPAIKSEKLTIQPPPRFDVPQQYPNNQCQPPPIVAQLDEISVNKKLQLENNEDTIEKNAMETLMDNIQVQPWLQSEDDVSKYNVKDIEIGMNKEINQLINKQSFTEADATTLNREQLDNVQCTQ
eukprot:3368911-Amphidinium_carterae.1